MASIPTVTADPHPLPIEGWNPKKGTLTIVLIGVSSIALATGVLTLLAIKGVPLGSLNALSHLKSVGGWAFVGVGSGLAALTLSAIVYITIKHYQKDTPSDENPSHTITDGSLIDKIFGKEKPWANPPVCTQLSWSNTEGFTEGIAVNLEPTSLNYTISFNENEFSKEEESYITKQIAIIEKLIPQGNSNYAVSFIYDFNGSTFATPFYAQFCQIPNRNHATVAISNKPFDKKPYNYIKPSEAEKIPQFMEKFYDALIADSFSNPCYYIWRTEAFDALCTIYYDVHKFLARRTTITLYPKDDADLTNKVEEIKVSGSRDIEELIKETRSSIMHPFYFNFLFWQLKNGQGSTVRMDDIQLVYKKDDLYYGVAFSCHYNLNKFLKDNHLEKLGSTDEWNSLPVTKEEESYILEHLPRYDAEFFKKNFPTDQYKLTHFLGIAIYHFVENGTYQLLCTKTLLNRFAFEKQYRGLSISHNEDETA